MSFPIYLIHSYFLLLLSIVFTSIGCSELGKHTLFGMGIRFSVALVSAILMTQFMLKVFPGFSRIAFGGRI